MKHKIYLGVIFKILNLIIFTIISLGLLAKSQGINPLQEFFIICISGTAFLLPWVMMTRAKHLKTKNYVGYIFRALLSIIGMVTWIEALKVLGPDEATLITYLIPFFIIIIASMIGEEKINKTIFMALIICLSVIIFTIKPTLGNFNVKGVLIALCSAISWALYEIICKKQSYSEHYLSQVFYTFLFASIIMFGYIINNDIIRIFVNYKEIMLLGVLRVFNVICLFLAYKFATVNVLSPFGYLRLVFIMVGNFLAFQMIPSLNILVAGIIISIINFMIFRKYAINRQP